MTDRTTARVRVPALGVELSPEERTAWIESFANNAADVKGLTSASEIARLRSTVAASFGTVYKAVVLDIDGTLAPPGSFELAEESLGVIASLLREGIPVAVVTGRGRTSAIELVDALRRRSELADGHLRRLFLVTHNGAFLAQGFGLQPITKADFSPMVSDEYTDWRSQLESAIEDDESLAALYHEVTREPYSLRVVVHAEEDVDRAREALSGVLQRVGSDWAVMRGTYGPDSVLEATGLSKEKSLSRFSDEVGVRPEQILRIGDQGQLGGNDYELLRGPGGFSVGELSSESDGCLPVLDDAGECLVGPQGVGALLELVHILPSISILVAADDIAAFRLLHEFERRARARARNEWRQLMAQVERCVSRLLRKPLAPDMDAEVQDMFDRRSGAVLFRDYEMSEVSDPYLPLFRAFDLDDVIAPEWRAPRRRTVFTDTGILLRGWLYYHFQDAQSKASGSLFDWTEYSTEACSLLADGIDALQRLPRPESVTDFKLLVGIVDNVRNFLIHAVHAAFRLHCSSGAAHISDAPGVLVDLWSLLETQTRHAIELLLDPFVHFASWVKQYCEFLERVRDSVSNLQFPEAAQPIRSDEIFRWREADWLIESVAAVQLGLEEFVEDPLPAALGVVGLAYGGLELPAIAAVLGQRLGVAVVPSLVDVSMYRTRVDEDVDATLRSKGAGYLETLREDTHIVRMRAPGDFAHAVILDDNCTTGRSLEAARDALAVEGLSTVGVVVVRFPGVNRWRQMTMPDHGMVDPQLYFGLVRGLVSSSPYTRLLRPGAHSDDPYLDELEFFDKARLRIDRLLYKTYADDLPSNAYGPRVHTSTEGDEANEG